MKKLFKKLSAIICFILTLIIVFSFAGCGADGSKTHDSGVSAPDYSHSGGGSDSAEIPTAPDVSGGESGDLSVDEGGAEDGAPDNGNGFQQGFAKQLTAAEWRDALDYELWLGLFEKDIPDENQKTHDGIFYGFATATRGLDSQNMKKVSVKSDGNPVVGAKVVLYNEDDAVCSAVTDSAGEAYLFGTGTSVTATSGEYVATASITDGVTEIELTSHADVEDELEIMLVVDTTGSMGDELSFLCDELAGVITRVSSALGCKIRLSLLFYRDTKDEYLTRKFDFVDVSTSDGLNAAVKNICAQKAAGGGDFPEAVDVALRDAVAADWHEASKTKLLFHVLDAPYHDNQESQSTFADAVKTAAEKGIRIIPVAASGVDTLCQYIMRSAALLTGGTYAFLTDDSGIGDSHELPEVGEYTVEYLSDLMVRLIKGYYTGTFEEPVHWKQSQS